MERQPILADHFYPSDPDARARALSALFSGEGAGRKALGVVLPPGSLTATGALAAAALRELAVPEHVVILTAAHAGHAPRGCVATVGAYRLPGARVPVDTRIAEDLAGHALLAEDSAPLERDHAVEAVLPLLLHRNPRLRVVPVGLSSMAHPTAVRIGNALADTIQQHGHDVLVVATSSLCAYVPSDRATTLDDKTLARIVALDGQGLAQHATEHPESMDGVVPVCVLLAAARALGRTEARVVARATRTPDLDRVRACVSHAAVVVD